MKNNATISHFLAWLQSFFNYYLDPYMRLNYSYFLTKNSKLDARVTRTANTLNLLKFVLNTTMSIAITDKVTCRLGKQLSRRGSTTLNPSLTMDQDCTIMAPH